MSRQASQILEEALQLSPTERAEVVFQLLSSLDRPDAEVDALWVQEAEDRITAYDSGKLKSFSAEEVFAELEP